MENDRFIILSGYSLIEEANEDAAFLKREGIDCKIITDRPEVANLGIPYNDNDWIYLKVSEDDFEDAADLLGLDPATIEDFEDKYDDGTHAPDRNRNFIFWGGIFTLIIIMRLLSEVV